MFKRATKPSVKWCVNCRFWTTDRGMPAAATAESYAQCRRFPPTPLVSTEPVKLIWKKPSEVRPYVPENAWAPMECWPLTKNTQWCGEWALPNSDDAARFAALQKIAAEE